MSFCDIVFLFNAGRYATLISLLQNAETACAFCFKNGVQENEDYTTAYRVLIKSVNKYCQRQAFDECLITTNDALEHLSINPEPDLSALQTELRHIRNTLTKEGKARKFISVDRSKAQFIDAKALFGTGVYAAFPQARYDIREAGNCLALECHTAAVFHLMRVAEHGLRALAFDRRIKVKKGPIELATWDEIIRKLEDAEDAIQGYPRTLAREAQFEFYHGANMEFKRFKNKFRNQVMHTREDYSPSQANSAFVHVKAFMQILGQKIAGTKRTPVIWKKP